MRRVPMRKIRDVLRLDASGLSKRRIAASLAIGATSVCEYLHRARVAGLGWPLPEELGDDALERLLFPPPIVPAGGRALPDWPVLHRELARANVTLSLLWEEYRAANPAGYGYSRFCDLYRAWRAKLSPTMRQNHVAGEKLFVDYAGTAIEIVDPESGEVHTAQVFIATLGASNFTYAEAGWSQGLQEGIGAHVRAFAYLGGVPRQVVCDNLKAGVTKACFHEPRINRTYVEMATHYGCAVIPARPYKPRDKAKVEVAVQVVERWILARLRNRRFFSLTEANEAIRQLLDRLNDRQTRHLCASRRELFRDLDAPALAPLPGEPYVFAQWKPCRAGLDDHVEIDKHYASVPHGLIRQELWARFSERTIEIFHRGKRVAAHIRGPANRRHTTVSEHMPSAHRRHAAWTPERIRRDASRVGPNTEALVELIMQSKPHPEQGFRAAIAILRLNKSHGTERLEAACERALEIGARSYTSVHSILKNHLDSRRPPRAADGPAIDHPNIRGPRYFH